MTGGLSSASVAHPVGLDAPGGRHSELRRGGRPARIVSTLTAAIAPGRATTTVTTVRAFSGRLSSAFSDTGPAARAMTTRLRAQPVGQVAVTLVPAGAWTVSLSSVVARAVSLR